MLLLLISCSDHGLFIRRDHAAGGDAIIEVSPPTIDFLTLELGAQAERLVTVRSVGSGVLYLEGLEIEGDDGFWAEQLFVDLAPGESLELPVSFTPAQPDAHSATLWVLSDDPNNPRVPVALTGSGLTPWLVVTPQEHDHGQESLGCPLEQTLVLQNVGNADLELSEIQGTGSADFSVLSPPSLPLVLAPSGWIEVQVQWKPSAAGLGEGGQSFVSNDPRGAIQATQQGTGLDTSAVQDTFSITGDPPVDLIFAVDQSGSMDNDAASLAANFDTFISTLEGVTNNWRIGVVTYDHGCFNYGVLDASTPDLNQTFADAVSLGTDKEVVDDEALFKLLDRALLQLNTCNAGFRRDTALLHMVVVSDEPERSVEQAAAWTWEYWLDQYALAAAPSLTKISGVVDVGGCSEGDEGYAQAISATGGLRLDICAGDWSAYATDLAMATLTHTWVFELSQDAASGSITVTVDGVTTSAWTYDSALNAVVLEEGRDGQEVVVSYSVRAECLN